MKWIASYGGPLLLAPERALKHWSGILRDKSLPTDYTRACQIADYLGVIRVDRYDIVVLGDEPLQSTLLRSGSDDTILVVRWVYANDDASVAAYISQIPDKGFGSPAVIFHVEDHTLYLFDSAIPGIDVLNEKHLSIEIRPNEYLVETAHFIPDEATSLIVHRMKPRR